MTKLSYAFYCIVIKANRCTTNSMWQYLQHQPTTLLLRGMRNILFFDGINNWKKFINFYQSHFTSCNYFTQYQDYLLSLPKSPSTVIKRFFYQNTEHLIASKGNRGYKYGISINKLSLIKKLSELDNSDWISATGKNQAHA